MATTLWPFGDAGRWIARRVWVLLFLVPGVATTVRGALDKRVEVPLVFEHAESALVDSFTTGKSSGWIWLPPTGEGEAHIQVGNVPFGFSVRTRLILEYDSVNVWPGNVFSCRAWLEPAEDPDQPEFYSCFGIEFGVK
ncbi:MAG: hypothetical protein KJ579_05435, partial [Verrucomicrobia bacterium]|nr:hypothetical protein [Verrucomicrobiota bacterium]